MRLAQEKAAESPGTQGKEEHTGCHEPQRVSVVAHTTAIAAYRPLWQGPSPTTHGIHNPPKRDAECGDKFERRFQTLARICRNCQEGNCATDMLMVSPTLACMRDSTSSKASPKLLDASTGRTAGLHCDMVNAREARFESERYVGFRCYRFMPVMPAHRGLPTTAGVGRAGCQWMRNNQDVRLPPRIFPRPAAGRALVGAGILTWLV
jgi:hypothetical protein